MKKIFYISVLLIVSQTLFAQDVNYSQNFSNPLSLNPAFAGSLGCSRFVADYKNQFISSQENEATYCASYDQYVKFLSGGIGLIYTLDNYENGFLIKNEINGCYALNIKINDNFHIRPAINIGYGNNQEDWKNIVVSSPQLLPPSLTRGYFNAGAGVLITYKNFVSGIAFDHLNQPNIGYITIENLPVKLTIHSSIQINITDKTSFTPGIIYLNQQDCGYLIPSYMVKINHIKMGAAFGIGFNNPDYLVGMIGFVNKWLSIGYSYNYTISKLTNATSSTHEITVDFKFNCKNKDKYGITKLYAF